MNPAWISQRVPLIGLALRIDDAEEGEACPVVLKRESLAVVRSAGDVVRAARSGCAMRLRAARKRERLWRQRARDQVTDRLALEVAELRAAAFADATRIASALKQDREQLLAGAETLLIDIARHAARRLLLDLPAEVVAQSSARLLREEWRAMRGEGESRLRVSPDEVQALTDIAADAGWTLVPDALMARGQCVLDHPAGSLHATYVENVRALIDALPVPVSSSSSASPVDSVLLPPPSQETSHDLDHPHRTPAADRDVALEPPVRSNAAHRAAGP
ncbi:FliH/SctL family protein [Mitsuaria sp. CC2]|uniref:FliH/SctL family protein n=1 Tax=Mitsuaria sp. CC2 TaxID=3029186 RepID=UPI003B8AF249